MSIVRRTEVRTTTNVTFDVSHLAFYGKGVEREVYTALFGINAGHPASLHNRSRVIDGVLTGKVKMTKMKNTVGADYFSLRLIGSNKRRTVYLRADAVLIVAVTGDSETATVEQVWNAANDVS